MIKLKSELERAEDFAKLICDKSKNYSASITSPFFSLCFVRGISITIRQSLFKSLIIVYDEGDIEYYLKGKLNDFEKEVLEEIEEITNKEIYIIDRHNALLVGRYFGR